MKNFAYTRGHKLVVWWQVMGHQAPGRAHPHEPAPAIAHFAQAMVAWRGVLLLTRHGMQGASASDHEARAGRRFEPQGGLHQWPDGSMYEAFRCEQRDQFLAGTSTVERQLGLELWIDSTIRHRKNPLDQDQQTTGLKQRPPGLHRLPGLRQGPDDVPFKDDVVGSAVWRGRLGITAPEGHRQPGACGFTLRCGEHLFREIDPDRRVAQFGHTHGEKTRPTSHVQDGEWYRASHLPQEIEPGLVLRLCEHVMARRQVKSRRTAAPIATHGRLDLVYSEHAQPRFLRITHVGGCFAPAILTSLSTVDHRGYGAAAPLGSGR